MATNVKVTPAESFPLGHAKENKDASAYTGFKFPEGGGNDIGVYKQPMDNSLSTGSNGYPETDVKTEGIKIRGVGAATKGTKARGPMA
jgi:hypothetical protein